MKKTFSIQKRLRVLVATIGSLGVASLVLVLALLIMYNNHYDRMMHNVSTASEFNQEFKTSIDQKMYYYVIESQYSEGLPMEEVWAAQDLARDLLRTTTQKDSLMAITSVLDLCENLEEKIYRIQAITDYDERQTQLENNIYILTALIEEYMYTYLYYEASQLNSVHHEVAGKILQNVVATAAVMGIFVLLALQRSIRISRSITQPLQALCKRAEDVTRGDLMVRQPVPSESYEIKVLSENMEEMISRLNEQIRQVAIEQESLRKTELALLQAQINPHFLYNTMDTIIWLMEAGKNQEAVEMVSNLSAFFRHSLSRGEDVITIGEEVRHVTSYLQIQHVRYKDILTYDLDIDPALNRALIPKLTLQPLVENALYHGIKLKRAVGRICIKGRLEGREVVLEVKDDGVGMTPARLEQLQGALSARKKVGFGMSAVNQRLLLQFGSLYKLQMESREGIGTAVTIRFPYREKGAVL